MNEQANFYGPKCPNAAPSTNWGAVHLCPNNTTPLP